MRILFLILINIIYFSVRSQDFVSSNSIDVYVENKKILNPFCGGLNLPQIHTFDVNFDGIEDIVIFERDTESIKVFLSEKNGTFSYCGACSNIFPEFKSWIIITDANGDGLKDIFAHNPLGVEIWLNKGNKQKPIFEKQYFVYNTPEGKITRDAVKTKGSSGYDINLNVNYRDIPAITDINGDGLADILCFGLTTALPEGVTIEYHRQTENLEFIRENYCWGGFAESYSGNDLTLNICSEQTANPNYINPKMHLGSALLAFDANKDGSLDLLLGEIMFSNAVLALNGKTNANPLITEVDNNFPSYDVPINQDNLPAFFLFKNEKAEESLIVAPSMAGSINTNNVWKYNIVKENGEVRYKLETKNFLTDTMIDLGEKTRVYIKDINYDGLNDLILTSYGEYQSDNANYVSKIFIFKNIGTKQQPKFELTDTDFGKVEKYGFFDIHLAFFKNSLNFLLTESSGNLFFIDEKNNISILSTKLPQGSSIELFKNNLLVGTKKGEILLYKNTAPALEKPKFILENENFLDINFESNYLNPNPVFIQNLDDKNLLITSPDGQTFFYYLDEKNDILLKQQVSLPKTDIGKPCATNALISSENRDFIISGSQNGGIFLSEKEKDSKQEKQKVKAILAPNPSKDKSYIILKEGTIIVWKLYDIHNRQLLKGTQNLIDTSTLLSGFYLIELISSSGRQTLKLIVNN